MNQKAIHGHHNRIYACNNYFVNTITIAISINKYNYNLFAHTML